MKKPGSAPWVGAVASSGCIPSILSRASAKYCSVTTPVLVTATGMVTGVPAGSPTLRSFGRPGAATFAVLKPIEAAKGIDVWFPEAVLLSSSTNCQRPGCGV